MYRGLYEASAEKLALAVDVVAGFSPRALQRI
jgi:hypothetical protein